MPSEPIPPRPRPVTEEELVEMERRATATWTESSADVLRLAAEVRDLRARLEAHYKPQG